MRWGLGHVTAVTCATRRVMGWTRLGPDYGLRPQIQTPQQTLHSVKPFPFQPEWIKALFLDPQI